MPGRYCNLRIVLVMVWVLGGLCVGAFGADDLAAAQAQYVIEAKIYGPDAKSLTFQGSGFRADKINVGKDHAPGLMFFEGAEISFGNVNVNVNMKGDTLTWNGEANPDPSVIRCLSSPKITTPAGETAEIRVGEESIQYFERAPDGLFDLKSLDAFTGYAFSCTATPGEDSGIHLKWTLETHRVKERAPIPDVRLDIGKPVIQTQNLEANVTIMIGNWGCFVYTVENEALLIFIRVTTLDEKGR